MDELARRIADVAEAVHGANKRTLDPVIIKLRDAFRYSDRVSGFAFHPMTLNRKVSGVSGDVTDALPAGPLTEVNEVQHWAESAAAAQPVPDCVWPVIDRQLLLRRQQKPSDHNWMQIGWESP